MIVPRSRLLFWVAAVVLPFALVGAVEPTAAGMGLLLMGLLALVALADAIGARQSLAGIGVALPAVARMSKDRQTTLDVRIQNERQRRSRVRVALGLPGEIPAIPEEMEVILPAHSEWSRLAWRCTPLKRGNYRLQSAYLEGGSPLGFWAFRKTVPVQSEIRVYPDLLGERKNLAALFLHRGAFGLHARRQVGKGRDFEKLREYIPGDSFDEIHWKTTAKRGRPITKVFQIERTQEVYVIIDASRLSARQSVSGARCQASGRSRLPSDEPGTSVLERFVTAALVLGLAAERQGDLFGLLAFSNRVETFVRAKNGKTHYSACRDRLYTLQPKIVTPDFDEVCTFIRLRMRRRALLVFLTSLDDPALAESFVRNMELLRRHHLVLVNMLQPPGATPLFTNPNVASVDELYGHLGGHLLWHRLRELERILRRCGIQFSLLNNERLSAELVSQYLGVKQRQLI
jgi:uncharacterized protein (DUF58 family)